MKVEQLLESAYDDIKADVVKQIQSHPQYDQLIGQLAERGFTALAGLIASA